jgi:hypothetical protein
MCLLQLARPGISEPTVEVITGLKEGDTVIIHPGDDLAEGTKVQPISRESNQKENSGAGNQGQAQKGRVVGGFGDKWLANRRCAAK